MPIQIFKHDSFGQVRVINVNGEPAFCLSDVCQVLALSNPAMVRSRLGKGVSSTYTLQTAGGSQAVIFINEDGLYDVILDSRKPEAKKFRKWVTSDVLPSIRKTGGYIQRHCKGALKRGTLTDGGIQKASYIPESDVYRLIMRSKLSDAERFQDWVFEDILPSIRKTGGYIQRHCNGITKRDTITPSRGVQELLYIPEPDVYRLIMRSKLTDAERF